jgi:hypothetical protein
MRIRWVHSLERYDRTERLLAIGIPFDPIEVTLAQLLVGSSVQFSPGNCADGLACSAGSRRRHLQQNDDGQGAFQASLFRGLASIKVSLTRGLLLP